MGDWRTQKQEKLKEKLQGNTFKLLDGTNLFRVMPNKKGTNHPPYIQALVHRDVGPDAGFCGCGHDLDGNGSCWLCDTAVPGLQKTKVKEKMDMAYMIQAKEVFITQVSRVDPSTHKFSVPKPFWVSTGKGIPGQVNPSRPTLAVQVESLLVSNRRSYDDPVKGHNMVIVRHGTGPGKGTHYDAPDHEDQPCSVPQAVLALIKPLEEFVPPYDIEDQKSLFYGRPRPERGVTQAAAGPRTRQAPAEPEPEEQFSDEPAAEFEEPTTPAEYGDDAPADQFEEEPPLDDAAPEEFGEEPPLEEPPADDTFSDTPEEEFETPVDDFPEPEEAPAPPPRRQTRPAAPAPPAPKRTASAPTAPARRAAPPAPKVPAKPAPRRK